MNLQYCLGKPTYKRTIFDLTMEELQKLCNILLFYKQYKITDVRVYIAYIEIDINDSTITILDNLNVHRNEGLLYNLVDYVDCIREMLSKEVINEN